MEPLTKIIASLQRELARTENKKHHRLLNWYINTLRAIENKAIDIDKLSPILNSLNDELQFGTSKRLKLDKLKHQLITFLETEYNLVFKGHYQRKWMLFGMMLGMPFGVVFSSILKNYGFVGIGLPIGLTIGIALGAEKDKKAAEEGRVLDLS